MTSTDTTDLNGTTPERDVLELSAIRPPRRPTRITTPSNPTGLREDGSFYEQMTPEDFSLLELQQLNRDAAEINAPDAAKGKAAERKLNLVFVQLIDGATVELAEELSATVKQMVMLDFFIRLNAQQSALLAPETMALLASVRAQAA